MWVLGELKYDQSNYGLVKVTMVKLLYGLCFCYRGKRVFGERGIEKLESCCRESLMVSFFVYHF